MPLALTLTVTILGVGRSICRITVTSCPMKFMCWSTLNTTSPLNRNLHAAYRQRLKSGCPVYLCTIQKARQAKCHPLFKEFSVSCGDAIIQARFASQW